MQQRFHQPSKEQVRAWLLRRHDSSTPVPDGEQIRCALGWDVGQHAEPIPLCSSPINRITETD